MTQDNNPYYDEDAAEIDIGAKINEPSVAKTLKQLGDALKGGFCNHRQDELKIRETPTNTIYNTVDSSSLSDESQRETLEKDKQDEASEKVNEEMPLRKVESVTVSEPLIIDETLEPKIVELEKIEHKEEDISRAPRKVFGSVDEEKKLPRSSMYMTSIVMITIVAAASAVCKFEVSRFVELFTNVQPYLTKVQSEVEDATGKDIRTLASTFFGSTLFLISMGFLAGSEKRLKPILEFVWGIFVYSIVAAGIYFTYDFTTN